MSEPNIVLTRVDNRLVHGQVGLTWTKTIGANLILVADDIAAEDTIQQTLMTMTAKSSGVGIRFFTLDFTAEVIANAAPEQKIFIVVREPSAIRKLIDKGVAIPEVNLGNMHFSQGKRALSKKVYVDDQDYEDIQYIKSKGVKIYIQDVPGDPVVKID